MNELSAQIEQFLRAEKRWISTGEIVNRFGVSERELRAVGDKPGLCTEFGGRSHGIRQLVRLRKLARRRKSTIAKSKPAQTREGQLLIELPGLNQHTQ